MVLKYVGTRSNEKVGGYCRGKRFGEVFYQDEETERALLVFDRLRAIGWNVDSGVANWACIEVTDKDDFNELMSDWKDLKKEFSAQRRHPA